jgi:hypothetical protein
MKRFNAKGNTMQGTINYINERGFFFISVKDEHGFITRYFGLRSRIIRGEENFGVGATVDFQVTGQSPKRHGDCQEASEIDIVQPPIIPSLSAETSKSDYLLPTLWTKGGGK